MKTRNLEQNFNSENNQSSKLFGKTRFGNSMITDHKKSPNHKNLLNTTYGSDLDELTDLSKKQAGASRSIVAFNVTNQFRKEQAAKNKNEMNTKVFYNNDDQMGLNDSQLRQTSLKINQMKGRSSNQKKYY